jgi:hypothetical protein
MSGSNSFKKTRNSFYEKQKFKSVFIYSLLILAGLIGAYLSLDKVLMNLPFAWNDGSMMLYVLAVFILPVTLLLIFSITRFDSIINDDGIFYRWMPYKKTFNMIDWSAVKELYIVEARTRSLGKTKTHNHGETHFLGGQYGLQIIMKSGRKIFLGTKKPEEVNRILLRVASQLYNRSATNQSFEYD